MNQQGDWLTRQLERAVKETQQWPLWAQREAGLKPQSSGQNATSSETNFSTQQPGTKEATENK